MGSAPLDGIVVSCPAPFRIQNAGPFHLEPGQAHLGHIFFEPQAGGEFLCEMGTDLTSGASCPPLLVQGIGGETSCVAVPNGVDFGVVPTGRPATRTLRLENSGTTDLEITPALDLSCGEVFTIVSGGGTRVLSPAEAADIGIRFQSNDSGQEYVCSLDFGSSACSGVEVVAATDQRPCAVTPGTYDFGDVIVGRTYSQRFHLTNNTAATVSGNVKTDCPEEIGRIRPEEELYTLAPGETHPFHFDLDPTLGAASYGIYPSDETCGEVPISWNGILEQTACALSVSELTFEAAVGEAATAEFVIENEGNVSLYLDVQFREPAGCAVFELLSGGGETRLDPGQELRVRVRYAPDAVGAALCHVIPTVEGRLICGFVTLLGTATD